MIGVDHVCPFFGRISLPLCFLKLENARYRSPKFSDTFSFDFKFGGQDIDLITTLKCRVTDDEGVLER